MNLIKRGLLGLSVLAVAGGATGGILASTASAAPTRGVEVVHAVQYSVNGGTNVGPWAGRGPISGRGNITDVPSLKTDPVNSSRTTLVNEAGSFTTLNTGGNFIPGPGNPFTCAQTAKVRGINVHIVSGTGRYRNATGNLVVNINIQAVQPRNKTFPFACNFNAPASAFETDTATAVGFVNLH
jgi:hypothetical protein